MNLTTTIEYSPNKKADALSAMKYVFDSIGEGKSHVLMQDQVIGLRGLVNMRIEHRREWRENPKPDNFLVLCFYHQSSDVINNTKTSFPNEIRIN